MCDTNPIIDLFLSDKNLDRCSGKIIFRPDFVFQEPAVRVFYILRQIGKEQKRWNLRVGQLSNIFDLNIFAFQCRRRIVLNKW